MASQTPSASNPLAPISSGKSPSWLALGLVSSSYFLALAGLLAFCIVLP